MRIIPVDGDIFPSFMWVTDPIDEIAEMQELTEKIHYLLFQTAHVHICHFMERQLSAQPM